MKKNNHIVHDIQKYFILACLLFLIVMLYNYMAAFLGTLFMAAVTVAAIYPVYKLLHKKLKVSPTWSAFLTLVLVAILILVPLTFFFFSLVNQATDAYLAVTKEINKLVSSDFHIVEMVEKYPYVGDWLQKIVESNPISAKDIFSTASDAVGTISTFLIDQMTTVLTQLTVFVLHAIVFLLAMFYFIRDGEKLVKDLRQLLPLSEEYRDELVDKMKNLVYSIIYGVFGTAIIQGLLVGIGLAIVGVSNAVFWGALAAVLSPVPYLGTSIIWVPVTISLFVTGSYGLGLFLLIWGIIVVGLSDNFLKPVLISSTARLNPLAVLLVLLGGVFAYGFKGLIFGPIILSLTLGFLHIYELEYKSVLNNGKKKTNHDHEKTVAEKVME